MSRLVCMSQEVPRQRGKHSSTRGRERYRYDESRYNRKSDRDGFPKTQTKSLIDNWTADVVYGTSPVLAALDSNRRSMHTLYVQEGISESKKKEVGSIQQAMTKAESMRIPLVTVSKHDLNMITNNRPHQGIVLDASFLTCEKLDTMPDAPDPSSQGYPVWLCLDEITDPQNLGAVIRSAYFLGAAGVLLSSKNSAPLSGVVSKASAGALEKMPIYSCRSLPNTLVDARSKGWSVMGASAERDSYECEDFVLQSPTILVMGSEGFGLRTNVRRACDASIRIAASHGSTQVAGLHEVDSLNVSVAAGILLHSLLRQTNAD